MSGHLETEVTPKTGPSALIRLLRERERKQAAVAELGQKALSDSDLQRLFEGTLTCVTRVLEVDFGTVAQYLPAESKVLARAGVGWSDNIPQEAIPSGTESLAGLALRDNAPAVMEDLNTETRFQPPRILRQHGIASGASVPIPGRPHPFGALSVFSRQPRRFGPDDINFLQSVAHVLAAAIERIRMEEEHTRHSTELAARVLAAQEEERRRIARELHDGTAQALSTLLMHLDVLDRQVPADADRLRAGLARVAGLARRTLDETRTLAHDLRPAILDDVGLAAALRWFAADYTERFGTLVEVEIDDGASMTLPPEVEAAIFRIAQEALTNCGKHAQARTIRVRLSFPPGSVRLVIADDGCGFDAAHVSRPTRQGRLGLYGMRERAALLGGSLRLDTTPGGGTAVILDIPATAGSPASP